MRPESEPAQMKTGGRRGWTVRHPEGRQGRRRPEHAGRTTRVRASRALPRGESQRVVGTTTRRTARTGRQRCRRRGRRPAPSRRPRRRRRRRGRMPCRHLGSRRAPTRHRGPRVLQGPRPSGAHGRRAPPGALREKRWRKPGRRPATQTARDCAAPQAVGTWLLRRAHRALERRAVRRARRGRCIRGPRRRDRRPTRPRPGARRSASRRPRWWRRACAPRDGQLARRRSAVLVRQRATVPLGPGRADRRRQHCHEWRHHRLDRGCRAHRHRSPCWGQGRVPSSRGRDQRWGR